MHSTGPASELALPHMLQMLASKAGITGLVEYYTGEALADTRVVRVQTVSEWKAALADAGERPVCALFTSTASVPCRVLAPAFARLPDAGKPDPSKPDPSKRDPSKLDGSGGMGGEGEGEGAAAAAGSGEGGGEGGGGGGGGGGGDRGEAAAGDFGGVDFILVALDASKDDGLVQQIFDEAYVSTKSVPTFVFLTECLEHRKWRYEGSDIAEVAKRLKRIVADDKLDDGPDAVE